jgi:hypothetical protein
MRRPQVWQRLFGRIDFQKSVFGPVLEKLLIGLILFVVLATSKQWIYPLIWPEISDRNFPIHVAGEAFTNPASGLVEAELYVVNLTDRSLDENAQREWLNQRKGSSPLDPDPGIVVRWTRSGSGMTLHEDTAFNQGKGRLDVRQSKNDMNEWRISVKDINGAAMMRIQVTTNYAATMSRGDKLGLPFRIDSPRTR